MLLLRQPVFPVIFIRNHLPRRKDLCSHIPGQVILPSAHSPFLIPHAFRPSHIIVSNLISATVEILYFCHPPAHIIRESPDSTLFIRHRQEVIPGIILITNRIPFCICQLCHPVQCVITIPDHDTVRISDTQDIASLITAEPCTAPIRLNDAFRQPLLIISKPAHPAKGIHNRRHTPLLVIDVAEYFFSIYYTELQSPLPVITVILLSAQCICDPRQTPPLIILIPGLVPVSVFVEDDLIIIIIPKLLPAALMLCHNITEPVIAPISCDMASLIPGKGTFPGIIVP